MSESMISDHHLGERGQVYGAEPGPATHHLAYRAKNRGTRISPRVLLGAPRGNSRYRANSRWPDTPRVDHQRVERRSLTRQDDPACPSCQATSVTSTLRTDYVVYYLCTECRLVWAVDKPSVGLAQHLAAAPQIVRLYKS